MAQKQTPDTMILIILVDPQAKVHQATGKHPEPKEALRLAWCQLTKELALPTPPAQPPAPAPKPAPPAAAADPPARAAAATGSPVCPVHHQARQSTKHHGWYCPARHEDGSFCKWQHKA